jgi:phage terminase large subunit GpA-like protein
MLHPAIQTVDDLAADWSDAMRLMKAGNVGGLQDFINSQLAESWKESEKATEQSRLVTHIGQYPAGIVPAGVQMLTAGVDIQMDHIWISVEGWGYLSEAWSIWEGRLETGDTSELDNYQIVREFLGRPWPLANDPMRSLPLRQIGVDCGFRPDVVLDFCRQCAELPIVPVRGDDTVRTRLFRAVKVAGGTMTRYDLNVDNLKNRLYRLLFEATNPGPGYYHLHRDTTDDVLIQLSSEEQRVMRIRGRERLIWVLKSEYRANHLWDCKVYAAFAAEVCGARLLQRLESRNPRVNRIKRGLQEGWLDDIPHL